MKCERCGKNPAVAQINQNINGHQEVRRLCQPCVDELMKSMGQMGLGDMSGDPFAGNAPFGFRSNMNAATPGVNSNAGNTTNTATAQQRAKYSKTPTLDQYGRDLTGEAAEGRLDPASGRNRELRRVITVLGRRQKNNPVLIGEPGVGKTAIVEGLARRIQ
ncbi:MAG: ATP-dependent Clp protease ATP-binding subunit, partial [Ktedonobacteraceae bacterium]